jgi:hypothetical protein
LGKPVPKCSNLAPFRTGFGQIGDSSDKADSQTQISLEYLTCPFVPVAPNSSRKRLGTGQIADLFPLRTSRTGQIADLLPRRARPRGQVNIRTCPSLVHGSGQTFERKGKRLGTGQKRRIPCRGRSDEGEEVGTDQIADRSEAVEWSRSRDRSDSGPLPMAELGDG